MKLRLSGNSIRLRLGQSDLDQLVRTGCVEEHTLLGGGGKLSYRLQLDQSTQVAAYMEGGTLVVNLPREATLRWAAGPQVGIEHQEQDRPQAGARILIEKDLACIVKREGEDDSDAFPRSPFVES